MATRMCRDVAGGGEGTAYQGKLGSGRAYELLTS